MTNKLWRICIPCLLELYGGILSPGTEIARFDPCDSCLEDISSDGHPMDNWLRNKYRELTGQQRGM